MKVALYPHPYEPKDSDALVYAEMDVLPQVGHVIRYENHSEHYEDGIVKEIRWDLTTDAASYAIIVVEPIE